MSKILNKYLKGEYEYVKDHRMRICIFTAILFIISLSLYIAGYITTKSNKNYLTIVAILGLLPASKSLVSVIMNFRVKVTDKDFKSEIESRIGNLTGMFHMYFTSYDSNFYINHLVITDNSLIGFSDDSKFDEKKFKDHLEKHMKIDGIENITIKVFNDKNAYFKRLDELNKITDSNNTNTKLYNLLYSITL